VLPAGQKLVNPAGEDEEKNLWAYLPQDNRRIGIRKKAAYESDKQGEAINPNERFVVSEEKVGEDGVLYLKLADGRGWLFERVPPGAESGSDSEDEDEYRRPVLCKRLTNDAAKVDQFIELWAKTTTASAGHTERPNVERECWDEARLRALCQKHGWDFEWLSEDGERRRRGAERQGSAHVTKYVARADSRKPDGFMDKGAP